MNPQDEIAVSVNKLHKDFKLPHEKKNSIKERVLFFNKKSTYDKFHALRDINFDVKKGEFFGIVGRNGSGKSTLLKIIGGIYQPTKGELSVNGTLTPFIELGIGFNPELTGRENVYLNGAILGLTRKEINAKYDEIVDFAELGKFMDQKLKNYSSGMQVRLAFSIAIQAHNDILLIDEVLAVGDTNFQRKCFKVFRDIKNSGKTVIFVTHDMGMVQEFCDRALMIRDSKLIAIGNPRDIALKYEIANTSDMDNSNGSNLERPKNPDVQITDIRVGTDNKQTHTFALDEDVDIDVSIKVKKPREIQVNAFIVRSDGNYVAGFNSTRDIKNYEPETGKHKLRCTVKAGQLVKGSYTIGIGIYGPGDVPDLIDIIDRGYAREIPKITILENSLYQDGQFYIDGKWSTKG